MIHLRFKQHMSHWFQLPLLAFPMLPNVANDPSQANFEIVSQTSFTHTLRCILCCVTRSNLSRRRSISGRSWRMTPAENGSSRRRHSCPADLAVSDPQLPLRRETKTRVQTEASSSSHGTSDTPAVEKSKLELELEDAVENGFELRKGIGLRFQRAHAPNTAKHAEYTALKATNRKHNSAEKNHCQSYQDVNQELGEYVCFAAMVEKFGHSYDPKGETRMFTLESATRWAVHGCHGMS